MFEQPIHDLKLSFTGRLCTLRHRLDVSDRYGQSRHLQINTPVGMLGILGMVVCDGLMLHRELVEVMFCQGVIMLLLHS